MKNLPIMRIVAFLCLVVLASFGPGTIAFGVSVTTSTLASDSGPAVAPNLNPDIKGPFTITGATSAVSSIKSNTTRAHATANATAKVVGGTVTKTASGSGWVDAVVSPNPTYDSKGFSWLSTASGTRFVAATKDPTDLTNPTRVPFSINFPAFNDPTVDYGFPTDGSFQNAFGGAAPPAQGVVRRNAGLTPAQLATIPTSMTNPILDVRIVATQAGVIDATLFAGTAEFTNNSTNTVNFTGDFITRNVTAQTTLDAASGALRTVLGNLPKISFLVDPDKEFDLTVDIRFALGDPLAPTQPNFNFSIMNPANGNFGVAAAFNSSPTMDDTVHFQLQVVPEPATFVLAALGVIAIAGLRRRMACSA